MPFKLENSNIEFFAAHLNSDPAASVASTLAAENSASATGVGAVAFPSPTSNASRRLAGSVGDGFLMSFPKMFINWTAWTS
jgi:hypothetical protein